MWSPQRRRSRSSWGTDPAEHRALAWERRRHELLGYRDGELRTVARNLGLSVRTLQRYEFDGAPGWYELALIGLKFARRRRPGGATS
jgi:hypothetical protein